MSSTIIKKVEAAKVVAIIRTDNSGEVKPAIATLVEAGITALEITSNTPNFTNHIIWARNTFPEILVGAGTIINAKLAEEAIQANAQFLVTPNMNVDVIKVAKDAGVVTLMGAMTPTDVATGIEYGADFIKLFPAAPLGIPYFKALLGPFNGVKFIAVGGVGTVNAAEWFAAGVVGIGVGGAFVKGAPEEMKENIKKLFEQIS